MAVPVMPGEVPAPALAPAPGAFAEWLAALLVQEAHQRHEVLTGVDDVISLCETAIARLKEAASLLQEPGDAAETIYGAVFEVVPPGQDLDPPLLGTAARLVDALFNRTEPLWDGIVLAGDLVYNTFHYPEPLGGPLQEALRDLGSLISLPHTSAYYLFTAYAAARGFIPGNRTWQLWESNHVLAAAQGRVALVWLAAAERESLSAEVAIRLCEHEPWEHMAAAEMRLQRAISRADLALEALLAMRDTLVELDQIVINGTGQGQAPLPP